MRPDYTAAYQRLHIPACYLKGYTKIKYTHKVIAEWSLHSRLVMLSTKNQNFFACFWLFIEWRMWIYNSFLSDRQRPYFFCQNAQLYFVHESHKLQDHCRRMREQGRLTGECLDTEGYVVTRIEGNSNLILCKENLCYFVSPWDVFAEPGNHPWKIKREHICSPRIK